MISRHIERDASIRRRLLAGEGAVAIGADHGLGIYGVRAASQRAMQRQKVQALAALMVDPEEVTRDRQRAAAIGIRGRIVLDAITLAEIAAAKVEMARPGAALYRGGLD